MKAAVLSRYDPEGALALELTELADPAPAHPSDVVIRVTSAGVCRTDLHVMRGHLRAQSDPQGSLLPYVPGHENAGEVVAVGSGVTTVSVGDRVLCHPLATCGLCLACRRGDDVFCASSSFPGIDCDGGFAEYLRTNERAVLRLPDGTDEAQAAPLADAGITVYRAVRAVEHALRPGASCVVLGVGGLGHLAVQIVRALYPVRILAIDKAERGRQAARTYGADEVFDVGDDTVAQILDVTGGGAAAVLDFVGEGGAENLAWRLLAPRGVHQLVGYGGVVKIPTGIVVAGERRIAGTQVGSYLDLHELLALNATRRLEVAVHRMPLSDVNTALRALDAGTVDGRAVLQP